MFRLFGIDLKRSAAFRDAVKDFDNEQRMRRDNGPSAFRNDVGCCYFASFADCSDIENDIARVLFEGVIDRAFVVAAAAVVIDPKSAADIEVTHWKTEPDEFAIKTCRFDDCVFDRGDIRNLRADVKMEKLERIAEPGFFEVAAGVEDLLGCEAEFGSFSGRGCPFTFALSEKFGANSDQRLDAEFSGNGNDRFDFGNLLDDDKDFFAEFPSAEGEPDIFIVFVTIADDQAFQIVVEGEGDQEFRFATGFDSEIVRFARVENLFDDLAELVDLDRKNSPVNAGVSLLFDRFLKSFVDFGDAVTEEILEADHERCL